MKQESFSGNRGNRQRNIILLIMMTILIIYIAVPLYGVIQDVHQSETVFQIEDSISITGEGNGILNKVIDFFFESNEIPVPVNYIIDVEGAVFYSDNTPYSNKTVELRSTPRYTKTDKNGYFIFKAVKTGTHTISVFDESGKIAASCNVDVSIDTKSSGVGVANFSGDTYTIKVSANVEALEIKLVLETDDEGNVQGISSLEITGVETTPSDQSENPGDLEESEQPSDGDEGEPEQPSEEEPDKPDTGGNKPSGGGAGGGGGGTIPESSSLKVYDNSNTVSFGKAATAKVNIFGAEKRIAPGMKGSYRFTVDNTNNNCNYLYTVDFKSIDTLPAGSKIPMVFRLKAGSGYVAGDADTWCSMNQLSQDKVIAKNSHLIYTLEWYWPDGANDNAYAQFSRNTNYSYTLNIKVTAQRE